MQCRDCAIPPCKATIWRWPSARWERNSQRTQLIDPRSMSRLRAKREIYIPSSGMRCTKLLLKRCETRSGTLGHGRSRLKSVTTLSNSGYGCRDDGKGVDPAILSSQGSEGHYGLPGMRERATLIGGKLAVWSEVDAGTEVELRVPASTAYAAARRSSWFSRKARA